MCNKVVFAIDPGNEMSGYVLVDKETLKPISFGKVENRVIFGLITHSLLDYGFENVEFAIEMIASYGMAVGKSVFDTCVWIGRFEQHIIGKANELLANPIYPIIEFIYRKDEKLTICGNSRAKDSNIRQALIDEFAEFDFKNGKGTKKKQDFFYGFSKDMWQAFAVAYTYVRKGR